LHSQVVRFQPRHQPFEVAVDEFRSGRFDACLTGLHGHTGVASAALRARALMRLGEPAAALDSLDLPLDQLEHHDRAEVLMLRGVALTRLKRDDDAVEAFETGRVYMYSAASSALEAEFGAWETSRSFALGNFDEAESAAERVRDIQPYYERTSSHFMPLCHSHARAYEYLGAVAATREKYTLQAALLRASLSDLSHPEARDVWYEANLLANLSFFVREFDSPEEATFVRARSLEMDWVPELAPQRFQILQSLGWCNALRGDHIGAFRDLRAAAELAPIMPQKIMATLDRAYLARELHQGLIASEELEYAESLAAGVDWNAVPGEHTRALLQLSEALATTSPGRARAFFERYRALKAKMPPHYLARFDRRARAEELVADASIARAEANVARASALFLEAFQTWDALGYRWRAALAACELGELGAGEKFVAYAEREAALRPQSWLAHRMHAATA
jgi:tetratricopeptide (TPR) repeat protein